MKKSVTLAALLLLAVATAFGADEARLMRFPTVGGDRVVFSYAGDLYSVSTDGGVARRLTSHIGYELFAHLSPDGRTIAFTGQYDGNTEVFTMPVEGGEPCRVTYTATLGRDDVGDRMGPNNIVMGWTPDGKNILFRSRCYTFNDFTGQLLTVPVEGGMPTEIPLKNGGFCSFSPDGNRLAYNYVFREFRTWKRYEGGMADDIRIFDFKTKKSTQITNSPRQEVFPMWSADGKQIYYLSDRDNDIMNLYLYDLATSTDRQVTFYTDYDIKFPTIGGNQIVYEKGGYIYLFDTATATDKKLTIEIDNDSSWSRGEWKNVGSEVGSVALVGDGKRVVVAAHGDLFSVPVKEGITYNLTNSCAEQAADVTSSPDGKSFAYISDRNGEQQIWVRDIATGSEKSLTEGDKTQILNYKWSPDSKSIAWADKHNALNITDVATGTKSVVELSKRGTVGDFNFSPDSRYIAFTRSSRDVSRIVICQIDSKKEYVITGDWYDSMNPSFSDDGKYLLFVSARNFQPTYGQTEWNHVYTDLNRMFILPLSVDAENPFALKNDLLKAREEGSDKSADADKGARPEMGAKPDKGDKGDKPKGDKPDSDKKSDKKSELKYNFDNCESRVLRIPVDNIGWGGNTRMIGRQIYYGGRGQTYIYDLDKKEMIETGANFVITDDGSKAIVAGRGGRGGGRGATMQSGGMSLRIIDRPRGKVAPEGGEVDLSNLTKLVDYHTEWAQVFEHFWRSMRDSFYDRNMHGVDWNAVHDKYAALVPYVNHRSDLTYIVGEMIAELNVGHAYSGNGNHPQPQRIAMGLLGARFSKDKSGYFRVERVIEGANWNEATRSPLTMDGVNVGKGDYIVAVNGRDLKEVKNIFETLIGTAGKPTELTVNTKPSTEGARTVLVTPVADESQLYYYAWVMDNTRKVSEATDGKVGYIHIPDMGVDGLNEFVKHYYPQLTKKALIIDDRGNGGGNVSPMIIERLMRQPTYFTMHTGMTEGDVNPTGTFLGPKVLLMNEYSASDGDLFPYRFKYHKLGTSIGRRTWGGVVGYSGMSVSVDGGTLVTPSYAPYAADGSEFIIEGRGVQPDIELFNDPYRDFNGDDEQLSKAIEVALDKLKSEQRDYPDLPAFPDKSAKRNK